MVCYVVILFNISPRSFSAHIVQGGGGGSGPHVEPRGHKKNTDLFFHIRPSRGGWGDIKGYAECGMVVLVMYLILCCACAPRARAAHGAMYCLLCFLALLVHAAICGGCTPIVSPLGRRRLVGRSWHCRFAVSTRFCSVTTAVE